MPEAARKGGIATPDLRGIYRGRSTNTVFQRRKAIAALRTVGGLSQAETAKRLGIGIATVKRADAIRKAQSPAK